MVSLSWLVTQPIIALVGPSKALNQEALLRNCCGNVTGVAFHSGVQACLIPLPEDGAHRASLDCQLL